MKQFLNCMKVRVRVSISSGKTPEIAIAQNLPSTDCRVEIALLKAMRFITFGIALLPTITTTQAIAQITPDTTLGAEHSVVVPNVTIDNDNADQIEGGALRGSNLFHSFLEFNIGDGQRVYFANPSGIETILTRVSGTNASNILGTLGVNGAADLFLINPNGIIFGANAQLDIAGSFLASTADSLVFENGFAFNTTNPGIPPLLTITAPIGLQYGSNPAGTISNAGNLSVGQNFTLTATHLNLQGELYAGRNLTLHALDTVQAQDNTATPFIASAGRRLLIQGNQEVNLMALNHPESGFFSGENMLLRSANPIGGDAHYTSGGDFRLESLDGSLGSLVSPFDPVIQASGDVSFTNYTGASLHILAGGSVNIGSVTITGTDITHSITETLTLSDGTVLEVNGGARPTLDIRAGMTALNSPLGLQVPTATDLNVLDVPTSAEISIDSITLSEANGLVFLTNQYTPNMDLSNGTIQVGAINSSSSLGNGGDVVIDSRGGIVLTGDVNSQSTAVASNGGGVTLIANEDISTTNIHSDSSFWDGGQISLTSRQGVINTSAGSLTSLAGSPGRNGGQITLIAESDITIGNINSSGGELGGGGDITLITQGSVSSAHSAIQSETFGSDRGGNIVVTARSLFLSDSAFFSTSTNSTGDAGSVNITATDTVSFDGALSADMFSGALSLVKTGALGNGGNLNISTGSLYVTNGAALSASTRGEGDAGDVNITATDIVSFNGVGNNGLSSRATSRVNAGTQDSGDGGNLNITTGSLYVTDGAVLSASTFGYGDAGTVDITATDAIFLDGIGSSGFASAIASRVSDKAQGNGGNLNITTGSLYITNAAQLSASTMGIGDAGNVNINATDTVYVDGISSNGFPTLIGSRVNDPGQGTGGNLNITTNNLSVTNGALVSVSSSNLSGQGSAGNLEITANSIFLDNQGKLSARTASGNGGNITLEVQDVLLLRNNSEISTNAGFEDTIGDGGNISINAGFIVAVPSEDSNITANAFQGRGGRINITTQGIFGLEFRERLTPLSDITASSDFGLSGVVEIQQLDIDPSQGLTSLPTDVVDPTGMIDYQCQIDKNSADNRFTMTGRGGLPPNPNEPLTEENWLEDLGTPTQIEESEEKMSPVLENLPASSNTQIVEAQGWMIAADGKVTLTAQVPSDTSVTATPQEPRQTQAFCHIPNQTTANLMSKPN